MEKGVYKLDLKQLKRIFFINLILIALLLGFSSQINYTKAQVEGESLVINKGFQFLEYSQKIGDVINSNSINITIPSSTWNLTSMEVNFTEVKLDQDIITIEEGSDDFEKIYKTYEAWAVQLNITEDILLFGVYIYGFKTLLDPINPVYVEINGYDKNFNIPNSTIYGQPVLINMSSSAQWYLQEFPEPVPLRRGQYFLVVNGTSYLQSDNSAYSWFLNSTSIHTNLHIARYYSGSWSDRGTGKVFCHKLIQRHDKSFNPEEINMSIQVDNQDYPVLNTGYFNISNVNLSTDNRTFFNFPIKHNQTVEIIFNATYSAKIVKIQYQQGSVLMQNNQENLWSVNFTLLKIYDNYSVKFHYPSNWDNLEILRNDVNVTSEVSIDPIEHIIHIKTNLILDSHNWQIRASSPRTEFDLDIRRSEYEPGQELRFSIDAPAPSGNYTFVLYNADHYELEDAYKTISYPLDDTFSFVLPTHSIEGEYHAYVYFFDGTNAGVETATFIITVPFTIDPITLFLIILAIVVGISVTISIVVVGKKRKRKVEAYKEEIFNKCMDILNLNYIMVSEKKSSLNVYEQVFTKQKIDPTLISGFLSAIQSFGIELTDSDEKTQTIKLEYKNSKVLMSEFKDFRIVIIMNELPSQKFFDSISSLAFDIELYYSRYLENFKGNIDPFNGIENLLKKHLNISFLYPLKIVKSGKTKVSPTEKIMIGRALESMKKNKQNYFYITHIMEIKTCDSKDIEAIFNLIDKNTFQPVI
ncbi:MAG: hypothetical protein ACXACC_02630 [Promethearchaeota archaeon]